MMALDSKLAVSSMKRPTSSMALPLVCRLRGSVSDWSSGKHWATPFCSTIRAWCTSPWSQIDTMVLFLCDCMVENHISVELEMKTQNSIQSGLIYRLVLPWTKATWPSLWPARPGVCSLRSAVHWRQSGDVLPFWPPGRFAASTLRPALCSSACRANTRPDLWCGLYDTGFCSNVYLH